MLLGVLSECLFVRSPGNAVNFSTLSHLMKGLYVLNRLQKTFIAIFFPKIIGF